MSTISANAKQQMERAVDFFLRESSTLRTGRATPALIEDLRADYYGTMTPLKQLASINAPEPMLLVLQVWDAAAAQSVERALRSSELGLNPVVEGQTIRLPLPSLTEERRQELVKVLRQKAEAARVRIRSLRDDAMKRVRIAETEKMMSEDSAQAEKKEIQHVVDMVNERVAAFVEQKEQEILHIS